MGDFSADWLDLREAADAAARAESLNAALDGLLEKRVAEDACARIVDLGCGTGSNLRYLEPRLALTQGWTLVDQDDELLERAFASILQPALQPRPPDQPYKIEDLDLRGGSYTRTYPLDLASELEKLDLTDCDLVTASALMDLVSADWFDRLAERCRQAGCLLFPVLTYDGVMDWGPEDPFDATVRTLFNAHQRGDKGFGPALGPAAPAHMEKSLRGLGFQVETARSDWVLGAADSDLQAALLEGFAGAALELEPGREAEIRDWTARRKGHLEEETSRLRVGHIDLLAEPPDQKRLTSDRPDPKTLTNVNR